MVEFNVLTIISFFINALIGGVVLWITVKIVGVQSGYAKAFGVVFLVSFLNGFVLQNFIFPLIPISLGFFSFIFFFGIQLAVWLAIIMGAFNVGVGKAFLIGIVQILVSVALGILGIVALIGALIFIS